MLRVLFFASFFFFNANGLHADSTAVPYPVAGFLVSDRLHPHSARFSVFFYGRIMIIAIDVPRSDPCTNCVYLLVIGSRVLYGRCSRCT